MLSLFNLLVGFTEKVTDVKRVSPVPKFRCPESDRAQV